jgi:mono/diheme cytochrome c family protein
MRPLPTIFTTVVLACAFGSALGQVGKQPEPVRVPPSLESLQTAGTSPKAPHLFVASCMGCHGGDGHGISGKIPAFNQMSLFLRIPEGRRYLTSVPGASNSSLTDAELADVLNWILVRFSPKESLGSWQPYTAAEVSAHRRPALSKVRVVRDALVQQLAKDGPAPTEDY